MEEDTNAAIADVEEYAPGTRSAASAISCLLSPLSVPTNDMPEHMPTNSKIEAF